LDASWPNTTIVTTVERVEPPSSTRIWRSKLKFLKAYYYNS
jgi:hypothetical protein